MLKALRLAIAAAALLPLGACYYYPPPPAAYAPAAPGPYGDPYAYATAPTYAPGYYPAPYYYPPIVGGVAFGFGGGGFRGHWR